MGENNHLFDNIRKVLYNEVPNRKKVNMNFQEFEQELECLLEQYSFGQKMLETELDILIKEFTRIKKYNPVEHIKTRIKSIESIEKKLQRKSLDFTVKAIEENIHDIVGFRIVCSFIPDVYDIVKMIQSSKEIRIIDKKDYIKNPKESGYSSFHLIVLVPVYLSTGIKYIEAEIQIRTVTMDFWASLDHKIRYKFAGEIPDEVEEEMARYSKEVRAIDQKMLDLNDLVNRYNRKKEIDN